VLLRREGWRVNAKRVYRLYREMGLQLRHKPPKRVKATTQQHINAPSAIAYTRRRNPFNPFDQLSLTGSTRAVVVGRSFDWQRPASPSNAYPPGRACIVHHLPLPGTLQSFRRITSCSIALSSDKSATILFNLPFSSSSWRSWNFPAIFGPENRKQVRSG
jgi:hypothetical protein